MIKARRSIPPSFSASDALSGLLFRGVSLFACALFAAAVAAAQTPSIEGQPVYEVMVVDQSGAPVSEKIPLLPLETGKPFDFAAERDSIRILNRMGDYSGVSVSAMPGANGLRVEFVVTRNFYNNVIRIEGLRPPPTEATAAAALRLPLGEAFSEDAVRAGVESLKETLRADGLYQAKVDWHVAPHEDTRQMDIYVNVDPGPRARIGNISVDNHTPYTDQELLKHAGLKPNDKQDFTSAKESRLGDKLKKYLVNHGYLGGTTSIAPGDYDAAANRLPLKLAVNAGPNVRIEISGARVGRGQRRKLLPMYAEGAADDDLIQEGRRNLRDYFQSQGYFNADVEVTSSGEAGAQRVISYQVTRGDKFRLAGVGFEGNKYFHSPLLEQRLALQPASFASAGKYSQQLMKADEDSIRSVYLSNGFRDVQVSATVDSQFARCCCSSSRLANE